MTTIESHASTAGSDIGTAGSAGAAPGITRWRIDPTRSEVAFRARAFWGLVTVTGRFASYRGTLDLFGEPAVILDVAAAGLDTGNAKRDAHLRSEDFFDAARHRSIRFVSESAHLEGEQLRVDGRLCAAGRSLPLGMVATVRLRDGDELELEAEVDVDHRLLGMTKNPLGMLRTPTRLVVRGRLVPDAH